MLCTPAPTGLASCINRRRVISPLGKRTTTRHKAKKHAAPQSDRGMLKLMLLSATCSVLPLQYHKTRSPYSPLPGWNLLHVVLAGDAVACLCFFLSPLNHGTTTPCFFSPLSRFRSPPNRRHYPSIQAVRAPGLKLEHRVHQSIRLCSCDQLSWYPDHGPPITRPVPDKGLFPGSLSAAYCGLQELNRHDALAWAARIVPKCRPNQAYGVLLRRAP